MQMERGLLMEQTLEPIILVFFGYINWTRMFEMKINNQPFRNFIGVVAVYCIV